MATQKFVNDSINDFRNAVKCAMAQLSDGNLTGYRFRSWIFIVLNKVIVSLNLTERLGIFFEPQVTLHPNKSLTLQFELRNCRKYWTSVLILIKKKSIDMMNVRSAESFDSRSNLVVPISCLEKRGNAFSLNLPSDTNAPCSFPMFKMMECEVYSIDIVPIYYTLQGQLSNLEFTVPPEVRWFTLDVKWNVITLFS